MSIKSLGLNSILFVAASLLSLAPLAAQADDAAMLSIHASSTDKRLPLPPQGFTYSMDVNFAPGAAPQIAGIRIKGPMTAKSGDMYTLEQLNAGIELVPIYKGLIVIKGANVSADAGGAVTMTCASANKTKKSSPMALRKGKDDKWFVESAGHPVNFDEMDIEVDEASKTPYIKSMDFSTR